MSSVPICPCLMWKCQIGLLHNRYCESRAAAQRVRHERSLNNSLNRQLRHQIQTCNKQLSADTLAKPKPVAKPHRVRPRPPFPNPREKLSTEAREKEKEEALAARQLAYQSRLCVATRLIHDPIVQTCRNLFKYVGPTYCHFVFQPH